MRQSKSIIAILVFGLILSLCTGQKTYEIFFSKSLNKEVPGGTFKGKYVILDFWQTWCSPCIASFEETNELMERYTQNSEIMFANITNEEHLIDRIQKILTMNPFNGYQLIDDQDKTFSQFNVSEFPTIFILSKTGEILWEGNPEQLNEELILEKTGIAPDKNTASSSLLDEKVEHYRVSITNSEATILNSYTIDDDKMKRFYNSSSLHWLMFSLNGVQSEYRIISTDSNSNAFGIDISVTFPTNKYSHEEADEIISHELQKKYHFNLKTVTEDETVWVINLDDEEKLRSREVTDNKIFSNYNTKKISLHGETIEDAFSTLENFSEGIYYVVSEQFPKHLGQMKLSLTLYHDETKLKSALKGYGLSMEKKTLPIKKLKLVFSKKLPPIVTMEEQVRVYEKSLVENYPIDKIIGKWETIAMGEKFHFEFRLDKNGQLSGKVISDTFQEQLSRISVKGNSVKCKVSVEGEVHDLIFWFLKDNEAKAQMDKLMLLSLTKIS